MKIINAQDLQEEDINLINYLGHKLFNIDDSKIKLTLDNLEELYNCPKKSLYFIIGDNWEIAYSVFNVTVTIIEWLCLESKNNRISQVIAMRNALIELLLKYKDYYFVAEMKPDTSYPFYESLKKANLINEYKNYVVTNSFSVNAYSYLGSVIGKEEFAEELIKNNRKDISFLRTVKFKVNDNFITKYQKNESRGR